MTTNNAANEKTAASGKVLQGQGVGTASDFSTATYPAVATGTGTILRADGTNWVASTSTYPDTNAINTILYASSANVMAALATANNGVLKTSGTGVPSIGTATVAVGGTGLATLTAHSIQVGNGTSNITQLAVGATGTVLTGVTGADPSFSATPSVTSITLSSGTALSAYVQGTFTPAITGGGSNPTVGYTFQLGQYTKIGRVVILDITFLLSSYTGGSGDLRISSLPFTIATVSTGIAQMSNVTFTGKYVVGVVAPSTTYYNLSNVPSAGAASNLQVTAIDNTFVYNGTLTCSV